MALLTQKEKKNTIIFFFCLGGSELCSISTCLQWDQYSLELRTQVHLWKTVMMTNTTSMGKNL